MSFETAYKKTAINEGLFSNNPADKGGATNYGVSLRWLKTLPIDDGDIDLDGDIDIDDVKAMKSEDAKRLFYKYFWEGTPAPSLPKDVGEKFFDMAVNMGAKMAAKCLQRAVRAVRGEQLKIDGIIGTKSLNAISKIGMSGDLHSLLSAYRSELAGYYRYLIAKNSAYKQFKNGWLNRAYQ